MRKDMQQQMMRFAIRNATASGRIARNYFRSPIKVDTKSRTHFDPVTEADREIEQFLRDKIRRHYPEHGVLGEEQGGRAGKGYTWIIDPIDGTRGFIAGVPTWGILLGLIHNGRPLFGLMHQPFVRETFYADRSGAWLQQGRQVRALRTRTTRRIEQAIVGATHPDMFVNAGEKAAFARIAAACRYTRFGLDCYGYCLLAAGFIDLVVEADLQAYDILPLLPLITSAGGVVTDWEGKPATGGGRVIAAANRSLHRVALEILNR